MSTDQEARNKDTYHRFHDAINSRDLDLITKTIDELISPAAPFQAAGPFAGLTAVQAQKRIWEALLRAFPDLYVAMDDLLADGDKIVARQTVTGTNLGDYRGRPPTGKPVTYREIFIARFADGQVVDLWGVVDLYSQLQQLGHIS